MIKNFIRDFWSRLNKRQKQGCAAIAVVVVALLVVQVIVFPLRDTKKRLHRSVVRQEAALKEVIFLGSQYSVLREDVQRIEKAVSGRAAGFNLFSYLEKRAGDSGIRGNLKSMTPSRGIASGKLEESLVDLKLERVTLRQLVSFLHVAESPAEAVILRKISIGQSTEVPGYLNVQAQFVTYNHAPAGKV